MELGNKSPPVLLREMRTLAGSNFTDNMLCTLWLQRLPKRTQELLAIVDDVDLDKLAVCADKAHERGASQNIIAVASLVLEDSIQVLTRQVSELTKAVVGLYQDRQARPRSRKPRSTTPKRSRSREQKPDKASPRQARQLDFISQFTTDITYVKGSENIVTDTLSRVQAINCPVIISTENLTEEQHKDQELQEILNGKTCLNLRPFTLTESQHPIYCECEGDAIKPYVPKPLRRKIDSVYDLAHPSGRSTRQQIRQKFAWPGINKDIISWPRTSQQKD
ncbi:hypothetical protein KM043_004783 [Ampulex compressa]|nr:hypothetical protein KM043_004783 [Ampulex compressa]